MDDFELTIRVRNNQLVARRRELGMSSGRFAEVVNVYRSEYSGFETMRISPVTKHGDWKASAKRIAAFHCVEPGELWPESVLRVQSPVAVRTFAADELARLMPPAADRPALLASDVARLRHIVLACTPREEKILRMHHVDGLTLGEVGDYFGISRERVRQIELKATAKVRAAARKAEGVARRKADTAGWRDGRDRYLPPPQPEPETASHE